MNELWDIEYLKKYSHELCGALNRTYMFDRSYYLDFHPGLIYYLLDYLELNDFFIEGPEDSSFSTSGFEGIFYDERARTVF